MHIFTLWTKKCNLGQKNMGQNMQKKEVFSTFKVDFWVENLIFGIWRLMAFSYFRHGGHFDTIFRFIEILSGAGYWFMGLSKKQYIYIILGYGYGWSIMDEEIVPHSITCSQRLQNWKRILSFLLINAIYVLIGTVTFEGGCLKKLNFWTRLLSTEFCTPITPILFCLHFSIFTLKILLF